MSLLLAYVFNEQSTTPYDYAGNKCTAASLNISFVPGRYYGYAAKVGQASFPSFIAAPAKNFKGLGKLTIFTSFKLVNMPIGANVAYLTYCNGFDLHINSSGKVVFRVYTGSWKTVTSATTVLTDWNTIGAVYDGTTLYIYINGVQDANTSAATGTISDLVGDVYIGNDAATDIFNAIKGNIDTIEYRDTALSKQDIYTLNSSPGGYFMQQTPHNFALGDLIADCEQISRGVVTWVQDTGNFYFYPIDAMGSGYVRVGNIYQTLRQYFMELYGDFDGNGNGQISIKYPIASWADYGLPANQKTFDYRGVASNGMQNPFLWFSEYQERYSVNNTLTSLYQETLLANTFSGDGGSLKFKYIVDVTNNANAKTVYLKFDNQSMLSYSLAVSDASPFQVEGVIKITSLKAKIARYYITVLYKGTTSVYSGTLNGVDFSVNQKLILQGQGVTTADITAVNGEGEIHAVSSF